jgi:hypothetical protein
MKIYTATVESTYAQNHLLKTDMVVLNKIGVFPFSSGMVYDKHCLEPENDYVSCEIFGIPNHKKFVFNTWFGSNGSRIV